MKRHGKRGFELSITFIVTLIICVVIFASSIYFIGKFWGWSIIFGKELDASIQKEIEDLLASGQTVALVPSTVELSPGEHQVIGIGISNTLKERARFFILIGFSTAKSPDGGTVNGTDAPSLEKWLLYDKDDPTVYTLDSGGHFSTPLLIKPNYIIDTNNPRLSTPKGTYVYKVCVLRALPAGPVPDMETALNTCRGNYEEFGQQLYTGTVHNLQVVIS